MAINLDDRYPGRANPRSLEYPQGSFKDRTAPDAQDGTYLQQDWANDIVGFLQYLLAKADIKANGIPDTALDSQYAQALQMLVKQWVQIVQGVGNSTNSVMSQKAVTDAINNSALGVGQTWQGFTNSRRVNTTYTNTTGRPIIVSISGWSKNEGADIRLNVDGLDVAESFTGPVSTGAQVTAVVPNGSYYKAIPQLGEWHISSWSELR